MVEYKTLKLRIDLDDDKTLRIDPRRLIDIQCDTSIPMDSHVAIEVRASGVLESHALYLPDRFEWVLGKDSFDQLCLVPLRKEEEGLGDEEAE